MRIRHVRLLLTAWVLALERLFPAHVVLVALVRGGHRIGKYTRIAPCPAA
jgi:hypothetical protein